MISMISVLAYVTMNEVARQLEDPFGHEVNQLPIEELHMDFNERLWVITQKMYNMDEWSLQYGKAAYTRSPTDIHHSLHLGSQPGSPTGGGTRVHGGVNSFGSSGTWNAETRSHAPAHGSLYA